MTKKLLGLLIIMISTVLIISGCSKDSENEEENNNNKDNRVEEQDNELNEDPENELEEDENEEAVNNAENEPESESETEGLTLQVTKVDQEAGVTIENNEIYQRLNDFVKANPNQGAANDFSMYIFDTIHFESGEVKLMFIAINRLSTPIENISFDFTLGREGAEPVWDRVPVSLATSEFGAIERDHVIPFMLDVTEEEIELIQEIDEHNQVFKIDAFKYDPVN